MVDLAIVMSKRVLCVPGGGVARQCACSYPRGFVMALSWLLLLETALYACCFICGIITSASLTICQGDFAGQCMLYGSVHLNGSEIDVSWSSSPSLCYFVTAISVCIAVFCFSTTLFWIYSSCVGEEIKRNWIWLNITLVVVGVFLFFLLVTGCILRVGRDKLCESIIQMPYKLSRCDEAQAKSWKKPLIGSSFYSRLLSAETAVWVNFFCWMIIAILVLIQRRRANENRSQQDDPQASPAETEPFFNRPPQPQ